MPELPRSAHAAALAALPAVGPDRLIGLLRAGEPAAVWARLVAGHPVEVPGRPIPADILAGWYVAARAFDVAAGWSALVRAGITVVGRGEPGYPAVLADDPAPPPLLFLQGDQAALAAPLVAVVGTRRCTRYGHDVARRLGHDLADAGVGVVSGLAEGIDAAAHHGALGSAATAPVGVVGSGLDIVYPRRNADLWRRVAAEGVLVSEAPLGARPERWRFPARNRIIAGLARVVVVVESHRRGGALLTVEEALHRDRSVLAVPGPVTSPASAGTNRLLSEGAVPLCDADDVLVALGLHDTATPSSTPVPSPPGEAGRLLDVIGWGAVSLDHLAERSGLDPADLAVMLDQLRAAGWVAERSGWWERVARR